MRTLRNFVLIGDVLFSIGLALIILNAISWMIQNKENVPEKMHEDGHYICISGRMYRMDILTWTQKWDEAKTAP